LNGDDLEKALRGNGDVGSAGADSSVASDEGSAMNKEEEIGFHKGSINTLAAERNELIKMIGNVEGIMQAHMTRLSELGVDINSKK